jgi:hypothetical protein
MREFRLPEPVDPILCEFDALNHVTRKAGLGRVALVMHGRYDRKRERGVSDVEWFVREGKIWTAAEIRQALRAAGFAASPPMTPPPFCWRSQDPTRLPHLLSGAQTIWAQIDLGQSQGLKPSLRN